MKKMTPYLIALLFLCSCARTNVPMGALADKHPKPFVKLESGTTVEPKTVTAKANNIKTDNGNYKKKEVVAYSDGKDTYMPIKKGSFAPRVYEGDINVYKTVSTHTSTSYVGAESPTGWHSSTHTHVRFYVEKTNSGDLKYMNYKTLRDMIPARDPGYKYLQTYKSHRTVNTSIMAGGLALFIVGAAILGSSVMSSSGNGQGTGAAIMLAGPVAILTGAVKTSFNRLNLRRAVARHNGLTVK